MKAMAVFVAFLAVILFFNSPVETAEQTAETLGVTPKFLFGAIGIIVLFFLIRGSRTPNGR
jgi:hypothetical protein